MRKKLFFKEKEHTSYQETMRQNLQKDDGKEVSKSLFYRFFVRTAYSLLKKPLAVFQILKNSLDYLKKYESIREFAQDTRERIELLTRLIQAYVKGEYKGVSKTNVALSLAALLYFLSPIDLIPDFLAAGLLDDFALLTWLYNNFQQEMEAFLVWEEENKMLRIPIQTSQDEE